MFAHLGEERQPDDSILLFLVVSCEIRARDHRCINGLKRPAVFHVKMTAGAFAGHEMGLRVRQNGCRTFNHVKA